VIRRLGAGAMGIVYAAYDPKLDRKVALKLLAGLAAEGTEDARQRLQREAQALAKLAHPNVVGVYDVDTHDRHIYVAMEFIAGRTLGTWMREQPRSWRAVLGVFVAAGRGLAAAHAAGLIHRDFKPENAMVGADGRVRVMDFGLARPTDMPPKVEDLRVDLSAELSPRALESPMTLTGTAMGTPAYMALEQFDGKADARSDQFKLLRRALRGPLRRAPVRRRLAGEAGRGAHPRRSEAGAPRRGGADVAALGGASGPDARARAALAVDGRAARGPRRRPGAATTALGHRQPRRRPRAGITGGAVWYTQQQVRACMGFEARLAGIWDEATKSRAQAAFAATGLGYAEGSWRGASARLDDYTQRWVAARREACEATQRGEQSGALLDLRMACLDERLQHVKTTAELLAAPDEDVVRKAVEAVTSLPRLERCAEVDTLAAELPPPEDPAVAARVAALDEQRIEARALQGAGKYDRGLEVATVVVTQAERLGHEPLQARAWLVLGRLQEKKGAYAEAEATLERAYASALGLKMMTEAADAASLLILVVGDRLARSEDGQRWAKHAEPLARAAGTAEIEAYYLNNLGIVAKAAGKLAEARDCQERAAAIREKTLGPDHPDLASVLTNLGSLARIEGKLDQARAYHERALKIWERALGPDHPDLASVLTNLGNVAKAEGKLDQARAHYQRALAIDEQALGPDHPDLAYDINSLGSVALTEGKLDLARAHFQRALTIWEKALGPDYPNLAYPLMNLGLMAKERGNFDLARAHFERALAIREKALGPDHPDHPDLADPLTGLGEALLALGTPADALAPLERALRIRSAHAGDPVDLAQNRFVLAGALWDAPAGPGRDRPRARELSQLAAEAYAAAGTRAAEKLAEARAWQSTHKL
jgi:tetratricopeptide (TPR) repeat protein/tRNA A-37 threonylcarbamoyl transferase component Bud32